MGIVLSDNFTRANTAGSTTIGNAAGWGTSSDGNAWTSAGATPTWSIASNQGKVTNAAADTFALLSSNTYGDSEALVRISQNALATANWAGVFLRYTSTTNFYSCFIKGGTTIQIKRGSTSLGTATFTYSANTEYWLRFRAKGTSLYGKAWADGSSEPSAWTIGPFTDANIASGQVGIYFSPTATSNVTLYDNFFVNDTRRLICDGLGGVFS